MPGTHSSDYDWYSLLRSVTGELPDIESLAFLLRKEPKEIKEIIDALISSHIIEKVNRKFIVKNYVKRQSPLNFNERQARVRNGLSQKREKLANPTEQETEQETDVEKETDAELKIDTYTTLEQCVFNKINSLQFAVNKKTKNYIRDWIKDFDDVTVIYRALEDGASRGAKTLAYIDKIMINWKANGIPLTHQEKIHLRQTAKKDKFEAGLLAAIESAELIEENNL